MKFSQVAGTILISAATAFGSIFVYSKYFQKEAPQGVYQNGSDTVPVNYASYMPGSAGNTNLTPPTDFQQAAKIGTPGVVHIKTKINPKQLGNNLQKRRSLLEEFFGEGFDDDGGGRRYYTPPQMASGSGVLISDDGYIVTNNHVVDDADEISVTLSNNKYYTATVVGTDPSTDLALIKIKATGLPYLLYGNSDDVQVGQWVLAVGYPLNLETTVTAGIVSAKSRAIGINRRNSRTAIESFIQTDAAVNQGNSGGALINTAGELIGINSAIASPTGAYAGYSYAIPVNLVKKVVNDLMKFGNVQRAYLGIEYRDPNTMTDNQLKELGMSRDMGGIKVLRVPETGAAAQAGIKEGDIITKINGVNTSSIPELMEQISRYKPGDKVSVNYLRGNKEYTANTTLRNLDGNTDIVKLGVLDYLGADFVSLNKELSDELGVEGGVVVGNISSGLIKKQTNMKPEFVILKAGNVQVKSTEELKRALNGKKQVRLEGFYMRDRYANIYYYDLNLANTAEF
ncbi:S1C family serine protease [Chitinophaga sp. GCM10012297]|uniref:Trypsin-like peptidase domain-containing protein n=1 Tax=Chitinophaga chungangae TaxID=2821488 RepID=A0ABS3YGS3_9BACT|nr:trypsin-like peptidase domain-containing protein [Chitinophaga chungangae]MBO9153655.1 trypsin-like peptidase domain-containing protein [Chitinophaga chungangae]